MTTRDELSDRIAQLSPAHQQLIALRQRKAIQGKGWHIPHQDISQACALSFGQERMWFLNQLEPGKPRYNEANLYQLNGNLDVDALRLAFQGLIDRHAILRTTYSLTDGVPLQVVHPAGMFSLPVMDLSSDSSVQAVPADLLTQSIDAPFDLSRDLMIRATLFKLAERVHVLLIVHHHIASDGWSSRIRRHDLSRLYQAVVTGDKVVLPEISIQYTDYALWQRERFENHEFDRQLAFWKKQLQNPPVLSLPFAKKRIGPDSASGTRAYFSLPGDMRVGLMSLAQQTNTTLYMVTLAAFMVLLYRYSGQDDLCIGTPIANRNHPDLENLMGFLVNTLVIRVNLDVNQTFREFLIRVGRIALQAYENQDLPFEKVVLELNPERNLDSNPFFNTMFSLRSHQTSGFTLVDLEVEKLELPYEVVKLDLSLTLTDLLTGVNGEIDYASDIFTSTDIRRLQSGYTTLLASILDNPDQSVGQLSVIPEQDRVIILEKWSSSKLKLAETISIHQKVELYARTQPPEIALILDDRSLNYLELNNRANRLAAHLLRSGARIEKPIGVLLPRQPDLVITLLAILKTGGVILILDPSLPPARIQWILLDSGADLVITSSPLSSLIEVTEDISLICLDSDWDTFQDDHSGNLSMVIPPESAMYILYTSGSTGMPKGVVVEHGKFTAHVLRMQQLYALAPGERVLQFSELSFDAGLEQLFCGLTAGLTVVMRGEKIPSAIEFQQLIESNRVNVVDIPPAYWRFWTESQVGRAPTENSSLRCVIVGGDVMDIGGLRAWQQTPYRKIRLINTYGPTEGVVGATSFDVTDELLEETIPIGKPLAGNKIYLLDAWMQPVPVGIQGEIYIGGEVLGRGYWKNPGLTAENFLPDPFDSVPGSRMYKTGDVALWYQDGNLEFMGRKDWQVKIRGYRIELGEIEFAVKSHPDVNEACVIRQELIKSEPRLVAYLTPTGDHRPDGTLLRKHLQQVLPDYMIPSVYKWLDVFPHTSSGKIDRRALPILDDQTGEKRYIPPHTAVEKVVIGVFQEVLNVDHIGLQDNFFELGGHSLLAIKVAAKIESLLGILIAVRLFFQTKAIAELISSLIDLSSNPGLLERRAALVQKLALMSEAEVDALLNSSELHNPG